MTYTLLFGDPAEQQDFQKRNAKFFKLFPRLKQTMMGAFDRNAEVTTQADKAIFFLGRLCFEDFMEIICLAANGYGIGAMKLVRGFYERAVTARYLAEYPNEADAFWNWRFVSRYKTIHSYVEAGISGPGWREKRDEMRSAYNSVKMDFEVDDCKKCGTRKINHTWSRLDIVSMAKRTGDLGMLVAQAYQASLSHGHCTSEGLMARLEAVDGGIGFKDGAQRTDADVALELAHTIMISVLECQGEHFKVVGLLEKVEERANELVDVWKDRELGQDPANL